MYQVLLTGREETMVEDSDTKYMHLQQIFITSQLEWGVSTQQTVHNYLSPNATFYGHYYSYIKLSEKEKSKKNRGVQTS